MASADRHRIAASLCAALAISLCLVHAQSANAVHVVFDTSGILTSNVRANALAEASRIWRKYDVALIVDDARDCDPATALTVIVDTGSDPRSGDAGLGAIAFSPDGTPETSIVLHLDAVTRVATSAPVMGLHPALWPAGLRQEIVARALGRALAHEIGHYLLRSPHHASSGLMQARQEGSALGSPSERPFGLTRTDRDRLRISLAAPLVASVHPIGLPSVCPIAATR